jgi:hypothetical protein
MPEIYKVAWMVLLLLLGEVVFLGGLLYLLFKDVKMKDGKRL